MHSCHLIQTHQALSRNHNTDRVKIPYNKWPLTHMMSCRRFWWIFNSNPWTPELHCIKRSWWMKMMCTYINITIIRHQRKNSEITIWSAKFLVVQCEKHEKIFIGCSYHWIQTTWISGKDCTMLEISCVGIKSGPPLMRFEEELYLKVASEKPCLRIMVHLASILAN